ncbi:MAG: ASCH domain-containing protein [Pseudomonadota bacterium]
MIIPQKAISIRQPWCHHILYDGKDIENRDWPTKLRGKILIHASSSFDGYADERREFAAKHPQSPLGGIVGMVEIVNCVTRESPVAQKSTWFYGRFGFVLCNPVPLQFIPCKGKLGFFTPDIDFNLIKPLEDAA